GLLLMPPDRLPPGRENARSALQRFRTEIEGEGLDPVAACLHFVGSIPEGGVGIVGVNDAEHLDEILGAWRGAVPLTDRRALAVDDPAIIDPSQWNQDERKRQ